MKTIFIYLRIIINLTAGGYILYLSFQYKSEDEMFFVLLLISSMICLLDLYRPIKKLFPKNP